MVLNDFNPRSPYGERPFRQSRIHADGRFQSTLPLRGATLLGLSDGGSASDFNPRSPYGERRFVLVIYFCIL